MGVYLRVMIFREEKKGQVESSSSGGVLRWWLAAFGFRQRYVAVCIGCVYLLGAARLCLVVWFCC